MGSPALHYLLHCPLIGGSLLLAGCTAASGRKNFEPASEALPPPSNWTAPTAGSSGSVTGWLNDFKDPELHRIVRDSLEHNPSMRAAAARLRGAKSRAVLAGADRFPDLAAGLSAGQDLRRADLNSRLRQTDRYDLALDLSWELDLWGRLRNSARAAAAEAEAAGSDFQAARLSLAVNAAKAYCNLVEAEQLAELSARTVENFTKSYESIRGRIDRGVPGVTALDEKLSRANLSSARSELESAHRDLDAARRTLESLAGRYPVGETSSLGKLPTVSRQIPAGLPSELLFRRPDILAAERRAAAEQQRVKAAWKALLPDIRLTATAGTSSPQLQELLDARRLASSIAQSLAAPLFSGGRLTAEAQIAEADRDALAATYAAAVLTAFREVETALAAEGYFERQILALQEFVKDSLDAESLAQKSYDNGLVTFVTVLESQRRAVDSQALLFRVENARLLNRLNLHLALGGDFD